jgi:branched-chain amino acid transport system permease protein
MQREAAVRWFRSALSQLLQSSLRWLGAALQFSLTGLRSAWAAFVRGLRSASAAFVRGLRSAWEATVRGLRSALAAFVRGLRAAWTAFVRGLRSALAAVVRGLRSALAAFVRGLRSASAAFVRGLRSARDAVLQGLQATVRGLRSARDAVVQGLRSAWEASVRWVRSAIPRLLQFWRSEPAIDAARAAGIAALLALPLLGFRLIDSPQGLGLEYRFSWVAAAAMAVFVGRVFLTDTRRAARRIRNQTREHRREHAPAAMWLDRIPKLALATAAVAVFAASLPFLPFADRNLVDRATLILIYVMLGTGLNIVVGLAGLLDLGYVAFYAVGAYSYALLAQHFGLSFWACLPLAGVLAAVSALVVGHPVLRLRGDYLAIVTLGFGQIAHVVLVNWTALTGGPNGIAGIARPDFFGLPFAAEAPDGGKTFAQYFDIPFSPLHRVYFLYYLILAMVVIAGALVWRLRQLPIGLAWEALREDEIACRSLGINPKTVKLSAYALGASFAGFAGSFFAARQGFISPESFTFNESAIILAIVVLSGMRSQLGIALAAIILIGIPEWFRDLAEYRMLAFAAVMVLIVLQRPKGLAGERRPTVRLKFVPSAETAAAAEAG